MAPAGSMSSIGNDDILEIAGSDSPNMLDCSSWDGLFRLFLPIYLDTNRPQAYKPGTGRRTTKSNPAFEVCMVREAV
jgi:hypothetical protein